LNTNHFRSAQHIAISAALALTIHIIAVIAFSYIIPEPDKKIRTVPVVIISPQGSITNRSTPQPSKSSPSDARISTESNAEFFTTDDNNKKAKTENSNDSNSPHLPALNQPLRQQQRREGLTTLFSRNLKNRQLDENKQISTKDTAKLSEYQQRLIQHMLQGKLYDKFHRILNSNNSNNSNTLDYTLNLWLLPNGAIKNASIKTSSGIDEIDKLAITAAYNASPYPKPPPADAATRYQYEVPVQYQP
jgi:TonB family protein